MNTFEAEVQASASALRIPYQKLVVPVKLCRTGAKTFLMPLQETPYDSFLVKQGRHIALELKSTKEWEPFPISRVALHQRDGLADALIAGASAYLLLNWRRGPLASGKTGSRIRAWALPWQRFGALLGRLIDSDRQSIPVEWLDNSGLFTPVERVAFLRPDGQRETVWDLTVLS